MLSLFCFQEKLAFVELVERLGGQMLDRTQFDPVCTHLVIGQLSLYIDFMVIDLVVIDLVIIDLLVTDLAITDLLVTDLVVIDTVVIDFVLINILVIDHLISHCGYRLCAIRVQLDKQQNYRTSPILLPGGCIMCDGRIAATIGGCMMCVMEE